MTDRDLKGIVVPVVTPTDKDENLDEKSFRRLLRFLIESGAHGILVGGSSGEGPLLDYAQWVRMAETAFDEVGDAIPLLGGAIDTSTRRVTRRITALLEIGYSNILVPPTFYVVVKSRDEHLRLFGEAKQACGDANLIAYNIHHARTRKSPSIQCARWPGADG